MTKTEERQHLSNGQRITLCELPYELLSEAEPVYDYRDGFSRNSLLAGCKSCSDAAFQLQQAGR